jgi:hypothetical protein
VNTESRHLTKTGTPHRTVCGLVAANVPVTALPRKATCPECVPPQSREDRIRVATRALMDAIVSVELHPINHDPYPGTVGDVADEIARYVLKLETEGLALGLARGVRDLLASRTPYGECRQGDHRDGKSAALFRIAYLGPMGGPQQWTVDVCERHAAILRERYVRMGRRSVRIVPAGWTPERKR